MTASECPHEYPFDESNTLLAVCRLCGFRYVSDGDISAPTLDALADILECLTDESVDDPQRVAENRRLIATLRRHARREARWGWVSRLIAPLAHPAANCLLLVGFWTWWLLDPARDLATWLVRAVWTAFIITMIVLRTQQIRRSREKTDR